MLHGNQGSLSQFALWAPKCGCGGGVMGPGRYETAGKSQSVLIIINPSISPRTRMATANDHPSARTLSASDLSTTVRPRSFPTIAAEPRRPAVRRLLWLRRWFEHDQNRRRNEWTRRRSSVSSGSGFINVSQGTPSMKT
jgi:hypothetical protein